MDGPFKKEYKIITVAWHVITLLSFADDLRKCLINYKVLSKLTGIPWSVMILEKLCAEVPNKQACSLLFYKKNPSSPINNLTTELCKKAGQILYEQLSRRFTFENPSPILFKIGNSTGKSLSDAQTTDCLLNYKFNTWKF